MFKDNQFFSWKQFGEEAKEAGAPHSLLLAKSHWLNSRWGGLSFVLLYFSLAIVFFKFASIHGSVSPIWPPAGLASLAIILGGRKFFGWAFLGALLSNLYMSQHWPSSVSIAFGNAVESLVCAVLVQWTFRRAQHLPEIRFPLAIFGAGIVAAMVGASIGIASLQWAGFISQDKMSEAWVTWWMGDWLGIILVLPFVYFFKPRERLQFLRIWRKQTAKTVGVVFATVSILAFTYHGLKSLESLKILFLLFYILLIPSIFRNRILAILNGTLLTLVILLVTLLGYGPFNLSQLNQNILHLDIFLLALLLTNATIISFYKSAHFRTFQHLMMIGWFFCGTIFYSTQNNLLQDNRQQIAEALKDLSTEIESEFTRHLGILTGGAALFRASDDVNSGEWKAYVEHITKFYNIPSVRGVGVVFNVDDQRLLEFEKKQQRAMDPQFKMKSLNPGESHNGNHFVITYIEPISKNGPARGLDLASEKLRREAAVRAIQSGEPQVTDTIQLVQDQVKRPGFLIYLPVYKKDSDISTPEARAKNFSHFIYSPVNSFDFFGAIAKKTNHQFHVEIFDNPQSQILNNSEEKPSSSGLLVYSDEIKEINANYPAVFKDLKIGGKSFLIKFNVTKNYLAHIDFIASWIALLGGFVVLLISVFIVNTVSMKDRASEMAQKLFDEYSKSLLKIQQQELKMREASKMASLGEMASGVAHEINNPLAIIASSATLLEKRISKINASEVRIDAEKDLRALTERIKSMVERISKIVKGLQHFARDGAHDGKQLVSLDKIIEDTLVLCQERFKNRGVEVRINLDFKGMINCREVEISQVLLNLLNNAYDAIYQLDSRWIEISMKQFGSSVEMRVKDSGLGIPKEIQEKILQPFFTTKEVGKGTGLGLSISKGIIESHGGRLFLDANSSHTTFVVQLPLAESQKLAA